MLRAFFDGSCEPNPGGPAAYGVVIYDGEKTVWQHSRLIDLRREVYAGIQATTNNVAEYAGFLAILWWLFRHNHTRTRTHICGDSKLVMEQQFGSRQIYGGQYAPLARFAQDKMRLFSRDFLTGSWVPREQNKVADRLSRACLP